MSDEDEPTARETRRARPTLIRGVMGVVPNLWSLWSEALKREGLSWRKLAERTDYTRAYLQSLCEHETIPYNAYAKICRALNIDPEKAMDRFEDEVDRRLRTGR
jgi:DNA-binding Xre family transcriptional regulator